MLLQLTAKESVDQAAVSRSNSALDAFEGALMLMSDPRRAQGKRYHLRSVVLVALTAMVCSNDDADSMADWGEDHEEWLKSFLELPYGPPSQDVLLWVFVRLDPKGFGTVLSMVLRRAPGIYHRCPGLRNILKQRKITAGLNREK
jgi:hypothetical protein